MLSVAIVQEAYSPSPSDLAGGKRAHRADDASPRRHDGVRSALGDVDCQ